MATSLFFCANIISFFGTKLAQPQPFPGHALIPTAVSATPFRGHSARKAPVTRQRPSTRPLTPPQPARTQEHTCTVRSQRSQRVPASIHASILSDRDCRIDLAPPTSELGRRVGGVVRASAILQLYSIRMSADWHTRRTSMDRAYWHTAVTQLKSSVQ